MARKSVVQEIKEGEERDLLLLTLGSLRKGASEQGAFLTKAECAALIPRVSKISDKLFIPQWMRVAMYSFRHEDCGTKSAVESTMKEFGISRSVVFEVRRRWKEYFAGHGVRTDRLGRLPERYESN